MKDVTNRYRKTISAEEAEALLQPHLDELMQTHRAALDFWKTSVALIPRIGLDDTMNQARARVISNFIAGEIRAKFADVPGVRLVDDSGFLVMVIDDRAVIRFKKLNDDLRPSNVMTSQQFDFATQKLLEGFPSDATNLTFGHKLDETGMEIEGFWLQCPRGLNNLWSISLDKPMELPLFPAEPQVVEEVAPPVVKAKQKKPAKKVSR